MYRASPSIKTLIEVLEAQQVAFEALLELLDRERACGSLPEINESKRALLGGLRLYEEKRSRIVHRLADNWAVRADTLTLGTIADLVGPIERGLLRRLHARLSQVLEGMRDRECFNEGRLAYSLAFLYPELTGSYGR